MRPLILIIMLALLSACATTPPPPSSSPTPDDAGAPSADMPYRPVMAGTAYHGVGNRP